MTREYLKSRRQSKSNSSNSSEVSKSPLLMRSPMVTIPASPGYHHPAPNPAVSDVEYVQKKPRQPIRSNTEPNPMEDTEQAFMHSEISRLPRRSKGGGTLPFIFRPDRNLSPPDESTMSHIRRLIYRTSHCYCCPPKWLRVQFGVL